MDERPTKRGGPLWWIPAFWKAEQEAAMMVLVFLIAVAAMFCAFGYLLWISVDA